METKSNKQQSATGAWCSCQECLCLAERSSTGTVLGPQYKTRKTSCQIFILHNLPDLLLDILWKQVAAVFIQNPPQGAPSSWVGWNFCAIFQRSWNRFVDGEPSVASVEGSSGCVKGSKRTEMDVSEHCGGILLSSICRFTYRILTSIVCFIWGVSHNIEFRVFTMSVISLPSFGSKGLGSFCVKQLFGRHFEYR